MNAACSENSADKDSGRVPSKDVDVVARRDEMGSLAPEWIELDRGDDETGQDGGEKLTPAGGLELHQANTAQKKGATNRGQANGKPKQPVPRQVSRDVRGRPCKCLPSDGIEQPTLWQEKVVTR